jgi:hypothetical protein
MLYIFRSETAITGCKYEVTKSFEYFEEGLLQYQNYETTVYVTPFEEDKLMVLKSDSTEANVKIKQVFLNEEEEIFLEQLLGLG